MNANQAAQNAGSDRRGIIGYNIVCDSNQASRNKDKLSIVKATGFSAKQGTGDQKAEITGLRSNVIHHHHIDTTYIERGAIIFK